MPCTHSRSHARFQARVLVSALALAVVASACTSTAGPSDTGVAAGPSEAVADASSPPPRPSPIPDGPLAPEVLEALEHRFWLVGRPRDGDLATIARSGDPRVAWPLVDLLRFEEGGPLGDEVEVALARLTGATPDDGRAAWVGWTDLLLAWDVPAPPDLWRYRKAQHRLYDPNFDPFFDGLAAQEPDDPRAIDLREVAWGGVPAGGIPELVEPEVLAADDARWLRADDVVFGVELGGSARAYPRRVLDVHELVVDTVGGVPVALAYCTLCGVATAWHTDVSSALAGTPAAAQVDGPLHLATSGLLWRSNKLMFDRATNSLFDQFDGIARTGPLADAGLDLEPVTVTTTTWAAWQAARPGTDVLARPLAPNRNLGDPYDGTFLRDRPTGPIFPTGARDGRLEPQVEVLGVQTDRGVAVAFPRLEALEALRDGRAVTEAGVALSLDDAGTVVARDVAGGPALPIRQAFWFAWSQFRTDTQLWTPEP